MTQRTLTEEKEELKFRLLDTIARLEKIKIYCIDIIDIIPIVKGLKIIYTIGIHNPKKFSRTIKYSDLGNGI